MAVDTVTLRPARLEDLAAMLAIERLSFPDPWSKASMREEIDSTLPPWVAVLDGSVLGYVCLWGALDERHITNLAVHPDFRHRGVGSLLLSTAIEAARQEHCRTLLLEVRPSNVTARRLYSALGFVELYRRRGYYISPSEDGLVMVLSLAEPASHATRPNGMEDD